MKLAYHGWKEELRRIMGTLTKLKGDFDV